LGDAPAPDFTPSQSPSERTLPKAIPDSVAVQVFADLITLEQMPLSGEISLVQPKSARAGSTQSNSRVWATTAAAAIALILGGITYVATDQGKIKIEINDPKAVVKIDGEIVRIESLGKPITFRTGEHELVVKQGNGKSKTQKFNILRGDNKMLRAEFQPNANVKVSPPKEAPTTAPIGVARVEPSTDMGRIKIEVKDPKAIVLIDGQPIPTVVPGDLTPLSLGEHDLSIKRGDAEIEIRKFSVMRGTNDALVVDLPEEKTPEVVVKKEAEGPQVPSRTPADAIEFDGKYYKLYNEVITWHEAFDKCKDLGGHLPIVRKDSQNRFLASMLKDAKLGWAWLGATDEKIEGTWAWIDGSPLTFTSWEPGQPNNLNKAENYLIVGDSAQWLDLWVEGRHRWMPVTICQWDQPPSKPR
jgi:hypothetical protein